MIDSKRTEKYLAILNKYDGTFAQAARKVTLSSMLKALSDQEKVICHTGAYVAGPVLFSFVWWVLENAKKQGINRLYFLARDGYVMHQIALLIREKLSLDIDCRYLYCSRLALRQAAYCLPDSRALDHLFEGGYSVTFRALVARSGLSEEEFVRLMGEPVPDWHGSPHRLSHAELREIGEQMLGNQDFVQAVCAQSHEDLQNCLSYFDQMGLLDKTAFGVVDTGWTGSMQKTMYHILASTGSGITITGFYFGLFNTPAPGTGNYHSWYLSPRSSPTVIGKFNNNIIECFCGNESPMTVGYGLGEKGAYPIHAQTQAANKWNLALQRKSILAFAHEILSISNNDRPDLARWLQLSRRLLATFIATPTREEAEVYGGYSFCDDMAESRLTRLAPELSQSLLREYHVTSKIMRFLRPKGLRKAAVAPVYWAYGSLAVSDVGSQALYRMRICVLNVLYHIKNNLERRS